uniref:MATH domain-containing protein n=1 Tax=Fagus sylvatica TaxID=28930 RepID=A0A2N9EPX9_FAGSY
MDVKPWDGKCDELTITRSIRRDPPTHFLLKIESYSLLSETVLEKYESVVFEACGHNWRLYLYPKGNEKMNGRGHISVYLAYAETEKLSLGLEVNASFKFFVYDQIRDNYFTIQDAFGIIRKFNERKTEWGFAKFLPLDTFNNESHGYLVTDCCIFGVEVFVYERSRKPKHWFSSSACDWGFSQFLSRKELEDTSKGFLVNDTLIVEAEIMVITDVKQFS